MPTAGLPCTARSMHTVNYSGCGATSSNPEINDATDEFTVEQGCVGFVYVVQSITFGDHFVEQQLAGLIKPGRSEDVRLCVARAEYGAGQRLVHQDEILQVDLDRMGQLPGNAGEHARPALTGEFDRIAHVLGGDERRRDNDGA